MKSKSNTNLMHYIIKRPQQSCMLILRNKDKHTGQKKIVKVKMTLGVSSIANLITGPTLLPILSQIKHAPFKKLSCTNCPHCQLT
jgi:hypothetical protein